MDSISYSKFRTHLAGTLDKVNDNHKPAVVMSLDDFQTYEETAYLMVSPKNAERLNQVVAEVEAGNVIVK